jgi:hypothetical protein
LFEKTSFHKISFKSFFNQGESMGWASDGKEGGSDGKEGCKDGGADGGFAFGRELLLKNESEEIFVF